MLTKRRSSGIRAGGFAHDPRHGLAVGRHGGRGGPPSRRFLGERLEVRLHRGDLGHRVEDRALDLLGNIVRLLEREIARELQVQRKLVSGADREHAHVVHLADARHTECSREGALAYRGVALHRLHVHDDICFRQR